jgi:O-antigen ligase
LTAGRAVSSRLGASPLTTRPLAVAAALAVALVLSREAVTSPNTVVQIIAGCALIALAFRWPLAALAVFVVLTFPESLPGFLGAGATLAKPLGVVLTASWLLLVLGGRVRFLLRDEPLLTLALVSFALWALASQVWATDPGAARTNVSRLLQGMVLLLIAYSTVRRRRDLHVLAWAYLAAASATSIYALATGATSEGRLTGGIINPNFFAAQLVVGIVLAGFMLATSSGWRRPLLVALAATFAVAFVLTQSRGGLFGAGVALAAAVVLAGPLRARAVVLVLIVCALALGYYVEYAPATLQERVTQVSAQSSAGRSDEWALALNMTSNHPIGGVGLGNFSVLEPSYTTTNVNLLKVRYALQNLVVHNTYLEILAELGIVGLILFFAALAGVFRGVWRGLASLDRLGDDPTSYLVRGLTAGFTGLLTAYFFGSGEYEKTLWLLLGLLIAVPAALRAEEDAAAAPSPRRLGAPRWS